MNAGKILEFGPSETIYARPHEEYTRKLIEATPKDDLELIRKRVAEREKMRAAAATIAAPDPRS
jgi:ABC-type oligopeptide transport system ATPase subunit